MLYALTTRELLQRPALWTAVHRLRHEVFVEELGWKDLARPDRLEIDQFDHEEAIHQVVMRNGELVGYQRLLPTTRPYQLPEIFPDLCIGDFPSGPDVYELTRYAVASSCRDGRRGVPTVGSELMAGFIEWGLANGVNKMIVEAEPMWVPRTLQLQFLATPLGYLRTYGNQQIIAILLQFNEATIQAVRQRRNHFEPVMQDLPPVYSLAS